MCSQFLILASAKELARLFGVVLPDAAVPSWAPHITPQRIAPVITKEGLKLLRFSLLPTWSKESRLKFSTHNARLETIESKATWKRPFIDRHCLVPISCFFEAVYRGEHAGNMLRFSPPVETPLVVAGIHEHWQDPQDPQKQIDSFAIITTDPNPFIKKSGHDRQPLFLNPGHAQQWLDTSERQPAKLKALLNDLAFNPPLEVTIERPLKPGWEKRVIES